MVGEFVYILSVNVNKVGRFAYVDFLSRPINDQGIIDKDLIKKLEEFISEQVKECRSRWKEELWGSEDIEVHGSNEFIGGKADAYEDCLEMLQKLKISE